MTSYFQTLDLFRWMHFCPITTKSSEVGHYSQDMAAGQGTEMNNILPLSAELWLCWMFSTPSWMSRAPPAQTAEVTGSLWVPPHQPGGSVVSQQVPHQFTRGEQALVPVWQNKGLVWSWDKAKQLHGSTAARNPRLLGSLSLSMACRTWGCANMTEHSERHRERANVLVGVASMHF